MKSDSSVTEVILRMVKIVFVGLVIMCLIDIFVGPKSPSYDREEAQIVSECDRDAPVELCPDGDKQTHFKAPGIDVTISKDSRSNVVVVADGMNVLIQKVDRLIDQVNVELLRRGLEPVQK